MRLIVCAVLSAMLVAGTAVPALGADLETYLDPRTDSGPFKATYSMSAFIYYAQDGSLPELLGGAERALEAKAGLGDPGVRQLMDGINDRMRSAGSQARVDGLSVEYRLTINGSGYASGVPDHVSYWAGPLEGASVHYEAVLTGNITNYVISRDPGASMDFGYLQSPSEDAVKRDADTETVVDLTWMGSLGSNESIIVDGIDVNVPMNALRDYEPAIYDLVHDTEASGALLMPLIRAEDSWIIGSGETRRIIDDAEGFWESVSRNRPGSWNSDLHSFWILTKSVTILPPWDWVKLVTVTGVSHPDVQGEISYDMRTTRYGDLLTVHVVGVGPVTLEQNWPVSPPPPAVEPVPDTDGMRDAVIVVGVALGGIAAALFARARSGKRAAMGRG